MKSNMFYVSLGKIVYGLALCATLCSCLNDYILRTNKYHDRGDYEKVVRIADEGLEKYPQSAVLHNNRGAALSWLGRCKEAVEEFRMAISLDTTNNQIYRARLCGELVRVAPLLREEGGLDSAVAALRESKRMASSLNTNPFAKWDHPDEGEALLPFFLSFEKKNLEEALSLSETVLDKYPDSLLAHRARATAFNKLKRYEQAEKACRKAIRIAESTYKKDDWIFYAKMDLANIRASQKKYEEATSIIRDALRLTKSNDCITYGRIVLGGILYTSNRVDEAIKELTRGEKSSYVDFKKQSMYYLALCYLEKDLLEKALVKSREAVRLYPEEGYLRRNLARVYLHMNNISTALEEAHEAVRLDPSDAGGYIQLGTIQAHSNDFQKAIDNFDKAIQIDANISLSHIRKGVCLLASGRFSEAEECFLNALNAGDDFGLRSAYGGMAVLCLRKSLSGQAKLWVLRAFSTPSRVCDRRVFGTFSSEDIAKETVRLFSRVTDIVTTGSLTGSSCNDLRDNLIELTDLADSLSRSRHLSSEIKTGITASLEKLRTTLRKRLLAFHAEAIKHGDLIAAASYLSSGKKIFPKEEAFQVALQSIREAIIDIAGDRGEAFLNQHRYGNALAYLIPLLQIRSDTGLEERLEEAKKSIYSPNSVRLIFKKIEADRPSLGNRLEGRLIKALTTVNNLELVDAADEYSGELDPVSGCWTVSGSLFMDLERTEYSNAELKRVQVATHSQINPEYQRIVDRLAQLGADTQNLKLDGVQNVVKAFTRTAPKYFETKSSRRDFDTYSDGLNSLATGIFTLKAANDNMKEINELKRQLNNTNVYIAVPEYENLDVGGKKVIKTAKGELSLKISNPLTGKIIDTGIMSETLVQSDRVFTGNPGAGLLADPEELPTDIEMGDDMVKALNAKALEYVNDFIMRKGLDHYSKTISCIEKGETEMAIEHAFAFLSSPAVTAYPVYKKKVENYLNAIVADALGVHLFNSHVFHDR